MQDKENHIHKTASGKQQCINRCARNKIKAFNCNCTAMFFLHYQHDGIHHHPFPRTNELCIILKIIFSGCPNSVSRHRWQKLSIEIYVQQHNSELWLYWKTLPVERHFEHKTYLFNFLYCFVKVKARTQSLF